MPAGGTLAFEETRGTAIGARLEDWKAAFPAMGVLALVAEADRETAVAALQAECGARNIPLRGAVFPALVVLERFVDRGVLLVRLDSMPFAEIYEGLSPSNPARAGVVERMCADVAERLDRPRETSLFVVFDAMVPDIASLLDALYLRLADGVHYFGANAGSETFRSIPCLFDNVRSVHDGALLVLLPGHPGAVVEHCYQAPERKVSATATEGNRIITIDWRPAFDVYREAVGDEYGTDITRETFYQHAVHFPFGIIRASGEILVRIPVALESDGSLFCVGEVPPSAILTLLRAPAVDSALTVEQLAGGLDGLQGSARGASILTFYCAGRRMHLRDQAQEELAQLAKRTQAAQVAGALSLGEIGHSMQWGYPLFHNGAIVCCVLGAA